MKKVYLRNHHTEDRSVVEVGPRFAGGAAGDIHRLPDLPSEVVKLYKKKSDRKLYEAKIHAMVEKTPKILSSKTANKAFPQLAWPVSIAEDKRGNFLGFTMPDIDFDNSVSLERMLQRRMREVSGLPAYYGNRFSAAHNLAVGVAALHKAGHHVIDLKPINCRLHPKKMFISILDCDGFSITGSSSKRFPADQFTPEYIAPEADKKKPNELGEEQDLFALAVIIFRLLNNGLHPYQGTLPRGQHGKTIQQLINQNYYAYSAGSKSAALPAKQSVHESFPKEIRDMFDQAFMASKRPKAAKWRDLLRQYADPSSGKLIRCDIEPKEHAYFDQQDGCGWCKLDEVIKKPATQKSRSNQARTARRGPRTPPISLSRLSKIQGRTYFILALLSAVALFVAPVILFPTTNKSSNKAVQEKPTAKTPSRDINKTPAITLKALKATGFLTSDTNLRSGAGKQHSIIMTIPKGTEVQVSGRVNGQPWYYVKLKSKTTDHIITGFLHTHYIAILK